MFSVVKLGSDRQFMILYGVYRTLLLGNLTRLSDSLLASFFHPFQNIYSGRQEIGFIIGYIASSCASLTLPQTLGV